MNEFFCDGDVVKIPSRFRLWSLSTGGAKVSLFTVVEPTGP
jgi:hypothetical protein